MQLQRFTNGGFCVHKATGYWEGHASAWFDRDGLLLDAEHVPTPFATSRPVKHGAAMWTTLQAIGRRWKHTPIE